MQVRTFSVVTPNLNMARFLAATIESVLANLQPGDEYFVIDGGSTDGSVDLIRRYESHLTGWVSEPDHGYADALDKGFRRCTGEFMCWVNSSDLLLKGTLRYARSALAESGADLIFGDDLHIDEQDHVLAHSRGGVRSLKGMMLYGGWTPLQDACYWRRSLYERVGGIDAALHYAADYDFFLRASIAGQCTYVPRVLSAFRAHPAQKSIRRAVDYERERQMCRRRMLRKLNIPPWRRAVAEAYYSILVRWRHHIARRLHNLTFSPDMPSTIHDGL